MGEAVRQHVSYVERPQRTPVEAALARFPRLARLLARLILRLEPASPIRRRFIAEIAERGYASLNRGDLELNGRLLYGPDSELVFHGEMPFGKGPFRGSAAIMAAYQEWQSGWESQHRIPREVIDDGERVIVVIDDTATGSGSGIDINQRFTEITTVQDGHIVLHEVYTDWREGLRAAGLEGRLTR